MSKRKHSEHHEEHADETWLIPYADMLTLLLALFIVLFASAQVDQKKIEVLRMSFINAFSGSTSMFQNERDVPQYQTPTNPPPKTEKSSYVLGQLTGDTDQAYVQETVQLLEVKKTLDQYITENNLNGMLETAFVDEGLLIRIRETALYTSGSAELRPESRQLAIELAKMLMQLKQRILIAGHTDNVPINTVQYPTNWDLSSKRALNFMKYILAQESKLQPQRFSAIGYGEYQPLATNDTVEGRAKNRRVEVLIIRNVK